MLGGHEITAKTRAHAKELLAQQRRAAVALAQMGNAGADALATRRQVPAKAAYARALTFAVACWPEARGRVPW